MFRRASTIINFKLKDYIHYLLTLFAIFISINCLASANEIKLSVPFPPIPVTIFENKTALVYELNITNNTHDIIRPFAIDVNVNEETLVEYSGIELTHNLEFPTASQYIGPGQTATLFVWLALPANQIPDILTHQMAYTIKSHPDEVKITPIEASIPIQKATVTTLSAPLLEGPWLASGIANDTEHRRSIIIYENKGPFIPERYAIDWTKYDKINGSDHHNDGSQNEDYYAYGQNVLASSEGTIVAIRNTLPDNPHPPKAPDLDNVLDRPGNYVVIQTPDNRYLVYCHLQPNILITKGQKVTQGQAIGLVGSSGDAGIPHLHFDIVNADNQISPFLADGLPYTYKNFTLLGFLQTNPFYYLNPYTPLIHSPIKLQNQLPLNGMFVFFN